MSPAVEHIEQRYLGGLLFVDETSGTPVLSPLRVEGDGLVFMRNRRNRYVLVSAAGLEDQLLDPNPEPGDPGIRGPRPDPGPIADRARYRVRVDDPTRQWLPRTFELALPRDPDPSNAAQQDSLFRPHVVRLQPSPSALISPGWGAVRVRVQDAAAPGQGLPFAVLILERTSNDERLGVGLTDYRGEGLVCVSELPAREWGVTSDDPIETVEIACRLIAAVDPDLNPLPIEVAELEQSREPERALAAPDIDHLIERLETLPSAVTAEEFPLIAGRVVSIDLEILLANN